ELMQSEDFLCVIDATHPFAVKVSESVRLSADKAGLTYKRLARQTSCQDLPSDTVFVENVREAATYLNEQEGIIFLTTGSKELPVLTDIIQDKSRLIARVLPMHESLTICEECGLKPSQIIAMQGPFSEEMNVAMLRSTKAAYLLTKETGTIGGMQAKVSAAASLGVGLVMIRNPERNMTELYSEEEILAFLGL
ncbi:MAG: precorrin-6A reductase, partial [Lachnospiraceae bacterium]|nr:precorrin-6A reductase [Candidatus Equihabitans merdae]